MVGERGLEPPTAGCKESRLANRVGAMQAQRYAGSSLTKTAEKARFGRHIHATPHQFLDALDAAIRAFRAAH